jgi:hypothetical protein
MLSRRCWIIGGATALIGVSTTSSTLAWVSHPVFSDVRAIGLAFVNAGDRSLWDLFVLKTAANSAVAAFIAELDVAYAETPVVILTASQKIPSDIRPDNVLTALVSVSVERAVFKGIDILVGSAGIALKRHRNELHMESGRQALFLSSLESSEVQAEVETAVRKTLTVGLTEPLNEVASFHK